MLSLLPCMPCAEGDRYLCVPPDPGIEAAALGASESALPGTMHAAALHTFTLDSVASRCFFRDSTTLNPLPAPVPVRLADPLGGPFLARSSTVLPCPAVSTAALQDARLYTLITEPPQVAASAQVSASGLVAAPCSCRLVSHQTLLWHHRLGHPSLPRLRGMHSRLLVSGLPRSLPPLPPSFAPPYLPCVEGRQRAAPHSSSFPPTTAPQQTLHMDVWGPARVSGQDRECYFILVVDDYTRYTTVFPLRSKGEVLDVLTFLSYICTLTEVVSSPLNSCGNFVMGRAFSSLMEVAHTSMIHAAAPHFLWPFAVRYAAHQLNPWPHVSLPETSPTLRWTGKVGDASVFRAWGSRAFVRDTSADKLSSRTIPCVFLGFPPDAHGWQFYHPTSRRVLPSQDVTFDEPVPFYHLFPYRTAPPPPPPDSGAARGAASGGAEPASAEPGGAEPEGAEPGGAESEGAESGGAEPKGAEPRGAEPEGAEPRGAEFEGAESGGAEPRGSVSAGGPAATSLGGAGVTAGAGGTGDAGTTGPGGARTSGTGAARGGGVGGVGAGDPDAGGIGAGGAGASSPRGAGVTSGAGGTGGAGAAGRGGSRTRGTGAARAGGVRDLEAGCTGAGGARAGGDGAREPGAGGAGVGGTGVRGAGAGDPGVGGAGTGDAGAGGPRARGTVQQHPFFVPPPPSSLPPPDSVLPQMDSLTEHREPESHPTSPVRAVRIGRRIPGPRPPPVPGTHIMANRPSFVPLQVPLSSPPASSLPGVPTLESDLARVASPTVPRHLATVVTDPLFESTAASALVAELVRFATACRLNYATSLVAESESDCPSSIRGECSPGTDVLEDRHEEFECFAAAVTHLVAMLLAPEGDPYASNIPTPRSYAEAITGPYSSQWQTAMDEEMASWKSTGTYVDAVPPSGANIVDGMWIFRVKRPPGSPPVFKASNVARGFRQRQGVGFFHAFSTTPKMTTLRVLLHAAAQRDYELHSLDLSTDFLQGSLHEEIWLRRPTGFTGSFPAVPSGPYPELVGCLMYLMTCTQPDLAYPLSILARYVAPGTSGMGLVLGGRGPVALTGHADASWVDDLATQRSSQGFTFSLGSGSVSWRSTRSSSVLSSGCDAEIYVGAMATQDSSSEAEIYAGAMAAQELRWLTYLLTDLGEAPRSPQVLYVDNKAMIALWQEHRLEHRTKHIALRYFLARQLQ
ncbi:unnamed protein product [Closterium sp. NIES-54]